MSDNVAFRVAFWTFAALVCVCLCGLAVVVAEVVSPRPLQIPAQIPADQGRPAPKKLPPVVPANQCPCKCAGCQCRPQT